MRTQTILFALCVLPTPSLADEPCPIQRLIGEPDYSSSFGGQMKIEASRLIVRDGGATTACPGGGDPFGCIGGALYSYRFEDGQWVDPQFIYPSDIGLLDKFGTFDVDGDRMIAGTARRDRDPRLGGLHVYEIDPATDLWVEIDRIPAPSVDPSPTSGFGSPIALSGDSVLTNWGDIVFLFQLGDEGWDLAQTINLYDPTQPRPHFGDSLVMNDDWAIVMRGRDDTLGYEHPTLYVYRRDDHGLLVLHDKVFPPVTRAGFGPSMALDGSTFVIEGNGSHPAGSIFVYELTDDGLEYRQEAIVPGLFDDYTGGSTGIGKGVSLSGDTMVCGSWRGSWGPFVKAGYAFKRGRDGQWRYVGLLDPEPATPYRLDGTTGHWTTTDGRYAVLGAPNEFESFAAPLPIGAAYSFDLDCYLCKPDLDLDGALTIYDFLTFFNLFDAGDMQADFDGDGELTIFDFLAFQTAFDAGCE